MKSNFKFQLTRISLVMAAMIIASHGGFTAKAEVSPVYSVQSPDAANLGMYGSVPVSLYTGTPDISVPIYELTAGRMKVPVSLNYHLSSVRPNQYPGSVGLGWSLNCGGCISRTVRGIYDEKSMLIGGNVVTPGFFDHHSEMVGITASSFQDKTDNHLIAVDSYDFYELSADEFSFNFCGYSGNFYLNEYGDWTVVSDQDIKVVFDSASGFGNLSELSARIPRINNWHNKNNNRRFFKEFTLITPDGARYVFGGINAIDFSIPYYNRRSGDLIATTWYLREIHTPDNHTVNFSYSTEEIMVDIRYVPGEKTTRGVNVSHISYVHSIETGRNAFTGFLLYPSKLVSVSAPCGNVRFDYVDDWRYNYSYTTYGAGCLYWSSGSYIHPDVYTGLFDDPSTQFTELFPPISGLSDNEKKESISATLRAKVLHRIAIESGSSRYSVYLSYLNEFRKKLNGVHWREGIPDIDISYITGGGISYPIYNIPERSSDAWPEYGFKYNQGRIPHGYVLPQADKWGYYNGLSHNLSDTNILNAENPPHNIEATKYETLEEVIYPTGGRSVFEYESHNYSKKEGVDRIIRNEDGISGGLRVRSIVNLTCEGDTVSMKNYIYKTSRESGSANSGIAKVTDSNQLAYGFSLDNGNNGSLAMTSMYGFGNSTTNINSPDVGYSTVFEETLDKEGNCLGYIKYQFTNYDTDIHDVMHTDELPYAACNISPVANTAPCSSNSAERGKLLAKIWYTGEGEQVRKEEYRYSRVRNGEMKTATQRMVYVSTDPIDPLIALIGWLTHTYTYSYMPVQVDVTEDGVTTSTTATYNDSFLKTSEIETSSDGSVRTRYFTYPCDYPGHYSWMENNHIVSPLISESENTEGHSKTTIYDYRNAAESVAEQPVPYLHKVDQTTSSATGYRTKYEVVSVDTYGNPTEIIEDGVHSVLVWGNSGQKLVKRIWDMTREEYENRPVVNSQGPMSEWETIFPIYPDEPERDVIGKMMWTYNYGPHLLLSSETSPDGISTFYEYDDLGRLTETSYFYNIETSPTKIVISSNEYHFLTTEER